MLYLLIYNYKQFTIESIILLRTDIFSKFSHSVILFSFITVTLNVPILLQLFCQQQTLELLPCLEELNSLGKCVL
jgi:hypothetical protein